MSHTPAAFLPSISISNTHGALLCHFNALQDKQEDRRSQAETLLRVSQFEIFSFLTLEKLQSGAKLGRALVRYLSTLLVRLDLLRPLHATGLRWRLVEGLEVSGG